jgi:asparagine synthase (glutamine-hydrolysing)
MIRYVGLVWDEDDPAQCATAHDIISSCRQRSNTWTVALDRNGFFVCVGDGDQDSRHVHKIDSDRGVIIGSVFRANPIASLEGAHFDRLRADRIIESKGKLLIDAYWGRFVAFLHDPHTRVTRVIKDPTGRLPCYVTMAEGVSVYFSAISDCLAFLNLRLSVDWDFVRRRVSVGLAQLPHTGLREVQEVYGGECISHVAGRRSSEPYWQPDVIRNAATRMNALDAIEEVRTTAMQCTHAWAEQHRGVVVRLSGGFDSSVVFACLRSAPSRPTITCLTYFAPGSVSDERPWAHCARDGADVDHVEVVRDWRTSFESLLALQPTPSPPAGLSYLETYAVEHKLATATGATAVFTGDGGDNIFGSDVAPYAIPEYLHSRAAHISLFRLASDVALIRKSSVWKCLMDAASGAWSRIGKDYVRMIRESRKLVAPTGLAELIREGQHIFSHPWLAQVGAQSAIADLLGGVMVPDVFYDPLHSPSARGPEPVHPLTSQPLVELCLRVPSFYHVMDGRDRGLARRAFAGRVPDAIINRLWKDRAQGFAEQMLLWNMDFVRELLLDGLLVQHGLLDRGRLERTLSQAPSRDTAYLVETIDHLLVEIWARNWVDRGVRGGIDLESHRAPASLVAGAAQ